jgi:excisionase family DNA binding protein
MANQKNAPVDRRERDQRQFEERLPLQFRRLLTVKEAAEILGLKASTIRAWLYQRRLPLVRCGRSIRIPGQAVAEFIEQHTVPACENRRAH